MADRIRTIKPELRHLEAFAGLTDAAARVFLLLPTMTDDCGRCPAHPTFIAGTVFWARQRSANVIGQLLAELEAANLIRRYIANGGSYLEVAGWSDKGSPTYQYIKRGHPQRYPAPPWNLTSTEAPTETSTETTPEREDDREQRSGPGTGSRSLAVAELNELARTRGPGGLTPPDRGAFLRCSTKHVKAGTLSVADCRIALEEADAKAMDSGVADGEHLDRYRAAFVNRAASLCADDEKTPSKRVTKTKQAKQKPTEKAASIRPESAAAAAQPTPPVVPAGHPVASGRWWCHAVGPDGAGGVHWCEFNGRRFVRMAGTTLLRDLEKEGVTWMLGSSLPGGRTVICETPPEMRGAR